MITALAAVFTICLLLILIQELYTDSKEFSASVFLTMFMEGYKGYKCILIVMWTTMLVVLVYVAVTGEPTEPTVPLSGPMCVQEIN